MEGALIILAVTVIVGFALYMGERLHRSKTGEPSDIQSEDTAETPESEQPTEQSAPEAGRHGPLCCGQHLVCEKYPPTDKIIYYDDEELDRFAGRSGDDYTDEEIEEFQEVLMTLRPEDALGWSRSVEQRYITLPPDVCDGLMLLITET